MGVHAPRDPHPTPHQSPAAAVPHAPHPPAPPNVRALRAVPGHPHNRARRRAVQPHRARRRRAKL
ncbi:hypothetical protein H0H81_010500 [Sphagnurus paluster]|uniref:Uncharacterized protein n=1 Tax=Sphagnurus paluster TaxID=117069 RepID=A0A9P7G4H7_9AGAR|nr:hypothetical protein H0H81_010500 [Sphagnurus paluster]